MRISDWSSDVCSSDLVAECRDILRAGDREALRREAVAAGARVQAAAQFLEYRNPAVQLLAPVPRDPPPFGLVRRAVREIESSSRSASGLRSRVLVTRFNPRLPSLPGERPDPDWVGGPGP